MWKRHNMNFTKEEFHRGINLTLRRGKKWLNIDNLNIGDIIDIKINGKKKRTYKPIYAEIVGLLYLDFFFLKTFEELLRFEHDEKCRTYNGLKEVIAKIYKNFNEDNDKFTLIFFFIGELYKEEK